MEKGKAVVSEDGITRLPNGIKAPNGEVTQHIVLDELTGYEEEILLDTTIKKGTGELSKSATDRLTEVFSRCTLMIGSDKRPNGMTRMNNPTYFHASWADAILNDRSFMLYALRRLSLGDTYKTTKLCPKCEKELELTVNLADLNVQYADINDVKVGQFSIKLPRSGDDVVWRFLRGAKDEEAIADMASDKFNGIRASAMLFQRIVSINGEAPTVTQVVGWSRRDREALTADFDTREGGVESKIMAKCDGKDCHNSFAFGLVGARDFLFPSGTA